MTKIFTSPLLAILSILYRFGSWAHRWLYDSGFLKAARLRVPVISVGNITTGGTGKTPMVDWVGRQLLQHDLHPVVLTRGFGRKDRTTRVVAVSDDAKDVGDEPLWLKRQSPAVQVIVGSNRAKAANQASDADIYVLDDGFQNYRLQKDLDIVLVDAAAPDSDYHLLPWGRARVPWNLLRFSDILILTKANLADSEKAQTLKNALRAFGKPVFEAGVYWKSADAKNISIAPTTSLNVALVSGLANPHSFSQLVRTQTNLRVIWEHHLRDHAEFSRKDMKAITDEAARRGAVAILTTEKDAVKWQRHELESEQGAIPWVAVKTEMRFIGEEPRIYEWIFKRPH